MHLERVQVERRARDHLARAAARDSPRRAATARARRCAGGRRRRRRSRCGLPRPPGRRRPRPAGRPPPRRRGPTAPRGRRASATSACCSSTSAVMPRTASSSSHCGGTSVSRDGAEPVHAPPGRLAAHAGHLGAHAAEVRGRRYGLELERERVPEHRAPAAVRGLDLGPLGERGGPAPLEQDRHPRPRRPVDVVGGVEEGQRERRSAHRSSLRWGESSYSRALPSTS